MGNVAHSLKLLWQNINAQTTIIMKTFIEDYLQNPSQAIANAKVASANLSWCNEIDENIIYNQISSGEFRLYEGMIFSQYPEEYSHSTRVASI